MLNTIFFWAVHLLPDDPWFWVYFAQDPSVAAENVMQLTYVAFKLILRLKYEAAKKVIEHIQPSYVSHKIAFYQKSLQ